MQPVPITTKVVSSNPVHVLDAILCDKVCQRFFGFLRVLRFPPPISLSPRYISETLLKVALNIITLTLIHFISVLVGGNLEFYHLQFM